ncbi:MAG: N-acetylmuramoyl-L-alanine amidase [Gammaproteobacteria bacterium]|nr:N-acetylmuramoyl-L-alanine amidase [Gammaproteobacteria bacterium]
MLNMPRRLPAIFLIGLLPVLQSCGGGSLAPVGSSVSARGGATVTDIRIRHAPEHSRFVFELSGPPSYKVFKLRNPGRVVIDLRGAKIRTAIPRGADTGQFIRRIRHGARSGGTRVVFDLAKPTRFYAQALKPRGRYQYRLVADFHRPKGAPAQKRKTRPRRKGSDLLVLIDPGHGGEDPGATGRRRPYEKTIVLQISKRLKAAIDRQPGLRAELTRGGDYYISLRKRTDIARRRNADMFISVHANGARNRSARGASVYALSRSGASSETAKWLANKENASDLVGGVSLADKEDIVADVLLDLSMSATVKDSLSLGRDVLTQLKRISRLHIDRVEQAGFVVLKSPDIPSILVETAFMTNSADKKLLENPRHQRRLANAIAAGVRSHVAKNRSRYARR